MGEKNSSFTRVQPVFNALLDRWPTGEHWVQGLIAMASRTRGELRLPVSVGALVPTETATDVSARDGRVFERAVPPPTAFLRWLIEHPDRMEVRDRETFGATSANAREWRRKLFS